MYMRNHILALLKWESQREQGGFECPCVNKSHYHTAWRLAFRLLFDSQQTSLSPSYQPVIQVFALTAADTARRRRLIHQVVL